jgi:hypothetical protein
MVELKIVRRRVLGRGWRGIIKKRWKNLRDED